MAAQEIPTSEEMVRWLVEALTWWCWTLTQPVGVYPAVDLGAELETLDRFSRRGYRSSQACAYDTMVVVLTRARDKVRAMRTLCSGFSPVTVATSNMVSGWLRDCGVWQVVMAFRQGGVAWSLASGGGQVSMSAWALAREIALFQCMASDYLTMPIEQTRAQVTIGSLEAVQMDVVDFAIDRCRRGYPYDPWLGEWEPQGTVLHRRQHPLAMSLTMR